MQILIQDKLIPFDNNLYADNHNISFTSGERIEFDSRVKYIVPGYIDRHTHGGYGVDYMDGNIPGNEMLFENLLSEGITTVIPTTLTQSTDNIKLAVNNCLKSKGAIKHDLVHLEGPYINVSKKGAQNEKYIIKPETKLINQLPNCIKLISYAPEFDNDLSFYKYITSKNIVGSIVHSDANLDTICKANKVGLNNFSHFYNGSNSFTHRSPGVVNAGLLLDKPYLELICDGYHVDREVIKTTYKLKGIESIVLITDSMRAKGCEPGEYDLGGQKAYLQDNQVRLKNGSLAGSVLKMDEAVKNFYKFTNCRLEEAFYAASTNVANSLNLTDRGKIAEGKRADIIGLDENLNVIQTYIDGALVYTKEK